jgi:hypothetical protein
MYSLLIGAQNGLEIKMSAAMHVQRSTGADYQDVVLEWMNSNLRAAGCDRVVKNLGADLAVWLELFWQVSLMCLLGFRCTCLCLQSSIS